MKFDMAAFGSDGVLAGSVRGQQAFLALLKDTANSQAPTVVFLDFGAVHVATGSFLRESVIAYRNHVRSHFSRLYPVVANANEAVVEELSMLLQLRNDALAICKHSRAGRVSDAKVIGVVDGKQQEALQAVLSRGEADAPTLARTTPDQKPTVWNNRLTALVHKGLLIEDATAKTNRYRPVLEGLTYGT